MSKDIDERSEQYLRRLFDQAAPTPAAGDFVGGVMRRIRRRLLIRRLALGSALILGALVAAAPVAQLAGEASAWLIASAADWRALGGSVEMRMVSGALMLTAGALAVLRWLAR